MFGSRALPAPPNSLVAIKGVLLLREGKGEKKGKGGKKGKGREGRRKDGVKKWREGRGKGRDVAPPQCWVLDPPVAIAHAACSNEAAVGHTLIFKFVWFLKILLNWLIMLHFSLISSEVKYNQIKRFVTCATLVIFSNLRKVPSETLSLWSVTLLLIIQLSLVGWLSKV